MTTLRNWKVIEYGTDDYMLKGDVYGHYSKKCYDGRSIVTSIIKSAEVKENELIVQTMNTEYHLLYSEFSNLRSYDEEDLNSFAKEICKENAAQLMDNIRNAAEDNMKILLDAADKKLGNSMLYLEITTDFFYKYNLAVYKSSSGEVNAANIYYDLLLNEITISDVSGECNVRYTEDYDYIKFHNTLFEAISDEKLYNPDGTVLGYIKNIGTEVIKVSFSWGKTINIVPGTEIKVVYGMGGICDCF